MDADATLLGGEGEDIDVVGGIGVVAVDKLLALDFAQGLDLVAVAGGVFEIEGIPVSGPRSAPRSAGSPDSWPSDPWSRGSH